MLGYYGFGGYHGSTFPDFAKWLRFDYSPSATRKGVLHHDCHLHMSFFSDTRLPVRGFPNPKQFVEMVFALCYPKIYEGHRRDAAGDYVDKVKQSGINAPCLGLDQIEIFDFLSHLAIPTPETAAPGEDR